MLNTVGVDVLVSEAKIQGWLTRVAKPVASLPGWSANVTVCGIGIAPPTL
jgi:hypothetical protein